jgi:hypothetical protein
VQVVISVVDSFDTAKSVLLRWLGRRCRSADRWASRQVLRPQMYFVVGVVVIEILVVEHHPR